MKQFDVFHHSTYGFQVVKEGFSWPAFFFAPVWACIKRMWGYALAFFSANLLLSLLQEIFIQERSDGGLLLIMALQITVNLAIAFKANAWRRDHLAKRGFRKLRTVIAPTSDAAVALAVGMEDSGEAATRLAS